jgi:hypothetical protein
VDSSSFSIFSSALSCGDRRRGGNVVHDHGDFRAVIMSRAPIGESAGAPIYRFRFRSLLRLPVVNLCGAEMDIWDWLSLLALAISFVALVLAIKSGPLEIDIEALTDRRCTPPDTLH